MNLFVLKTKGTRVSDLGKVSMDDLVAMAAPRFRGTREMGVEAFLSEVNYPYLILPITFQPFDGEYELRVGGQTLVVPKLLS